MHPLEPFYNISTWAELNYVRGAKSPECMRTANEWDNRANMLRQCDRLREGVDLIEICTDFNHPVSVLLAHRLLDNLVDSII